MVVVGRTTRQGGRRDDSYGRVEDAAVLDSFFGQLDRETRFMLYEAGERPRTSRGSAGGSRPWSRPQSGHVAAGAGGEVQGFAALLGGGLARNRHCALVVMGLRSGARGQGWGNGCCVP